MQRDDGKLLTQFLSGAGKTVYENALLAISRYSMRPLLERGVLIGLSGGADSVTLLLLLAHYRASTAHFPIVAVHVNHMIRGEEADRDERFSKQLAEKYGIEFISVKRDVPKLAIERSEGLEECARNVRYSVFSEIISSRNDIATIAVAHNADDNMETALLNILRGSGSRGAAGIPPVRDNIVRPLILSSKALITETLRSGGIDYVTDSTNVSSDYKRNFIRNEIAPLMRKLSASAEQMFLRLSDNLRSDDDFITSVAHRFISDRSIITNSDLCALDRAVLVRVISIMADTSVSSSCISDLIPLLSKDNFSYDLGGGRVLSAERGICRILAHGFDPYDYRICLKEGKTEINSLDSDFFISDCQIPKTSLNVYKISIQADLSSAIIIGELFIRPRQDGDTVYYNGMTHKLKKLYNDRKIPNSLKKSIPVLCDGKGVVWIPGFGVRDDGADGTTGKKRYAALGIGKGDALSDVRLRSGSEFR